VLLKTRDRDPQLVPCKVAGRSYDVRESCRRVNMEQKNASTAVSSHEVPSLLPALTIRATRLGAHNPVCDSCMCYWPTGCHGPARWQPVELPWTTQSTFTTTISYFLPYLCIVSALSQSIAAFRRPVERNMQRISLITPRWRLRDSVDALERTQQPLQQVRMCIRVRNVSPKCSTWLHLGSWGWERLHSNVGHPKSKRETTNLFYWNHVSTHRFSEQKVEGEALVPHSLHDLGSESSPSHLV